ncbi:MAG TPA: GPR endopeptidase [Firmicutes bacterium]|nr:GPR endopeptidase [Bacillota bacterium]
MQNCRTDLALESLEAAGETGTASIPGVNSWEEEKEGIRITTVEITHAEAEKRLGKPCGKYVTLQTQGLGRFTGNFEGEASVIAEQIAGFLPEQGLVLVIGLGNSEITPDALGPYCIADTLATRHLSGETARAAGLDGLRPVAALAPGVLGQTGMEAAEVAESVCGTLHPAAVIAVDALASRSIDRLATTIQISDTGISPGSGVQNRRKELSVHTLGVPVISIGVPTVVDMSTIAEDLTGSTESVSEKGRHMMVTPREIDQVIKQAAKMVAAALNLALQPTLNMEDILSLTA